MPAARFWFLLWCLQFVTTILVGVSWYLTYGSCA